MKTRVDRYIFPLLILVIITSCQDEVVTSDIQRKQTIDIQGANTEIKNSVGIDLLNYKTRIDDKFPADSFYVAVCEDLLFDTGESKIYNAFGSIMTFDNGDSILSNQKDTLFVTIFHCIGNNFYLDDCADINTDTTFCNFKRDAQDRFLSVKNIYTLSVTNTIGDIYDQFKEGNLNYDELSYMVVVHHLLHDISTLEK